MNKLYQQIEDLKDNLLYIENQIVEDMEIAIKEFDGKLQLIAKEMQDYITGDYGFKKILDAIKDFGQKLQELTKSELDRFQLQMNNNQDLPPEMDDDLIQLLENKETLLGTIGNIKDSLTQKANAKVGEWEGGVCEGKLGDHADRQGRAEPDHGVQGQAVRAEPEERAADPHADPGVPEAVRGAAARVG